MAAVTNAMGCTILWFRKDLRLDDNLALHAACQKVGPVIPVYIHEPERDGTGPLGAAQLWWLHHSLVALQAALRQRGSDLMLMRGDALVTLNALIDETDAAAVVWNRRYDPPGIAVDTRVKEELAARQVDVQAGTHRHRRSPGLRVS